MTDDRNDGGMPPPSEPAAPPPPLAAAPPPQPVPQPAPPAPPPASAGGSGKWILFIILAFAVGVGSTILVLWLTGDLWNSQSRYPSPSYGSTSSTGTTGTTGTSPYGSPPPTTAGIPPTDSTIVGTWGTRCPGSRASAVTFSGDHTMMDETGQRGSWSLSGNYLTATTQRETTVLYWEMVGNGTARARPSGGNRTLTLSRCE